MNWQNSSILYRTRKEKILYVHIFTLYFFIFQIHIGTCQGSIQTISNTQVAGSGILPNDERVYFCIGIYMWSNRATNSQKLVCMQDGKWSTISLTCKSVPLQNNAVIILIVERHIFMFGKFRDKQYRMLDFPRESKSGSRSRLGWGSQ